MYPQNNWKQVAFNGTVRIYTSWKVMSCTCIYAWGVGCSISNSCVLVYFAGLWFWSQEASPGLWHSEYGHFIQGMCTVCVTKLRAYYLCFKQAKREAGLGHSQTFYMCFFRLSPTQRPRPQTVNHLFITYSTASNKTLAGGPGCLRLMAGISQ